MVEVYPRSVVREHFLSGVYLSPSCCSTFTLPTPHPLLCLPPPPCRWCQVHIWGSSAIWTSILVCCSSPLDTHVGTDPMWVSCGCPIYHMWKMELLKLSSVCSSLWVVSPPRPSTGNPRPIHFFPLAHRYPCLSLVMVSLKHFSSLCSPFDHHHCLKGDPPIPCLSCCKSPGTSLLICHWAQVCPALYLWLYPEPRPIFLCQPRNFNKVTTFSASVSSFVT